MALVLVSGLACLAPVRASDASLPGGAGPASASTATSHVHPAMTAGGHADHQTKTDKAMHGTRSPSGAAAASLVVSRAWVRWLPGALPAAAYMTLENHGAVPLTIISASSPDYGDVMLHRTVQTDNHETMRAVDALSIAPGMTVQAAPSAAGGYHWMLMHPTHPITVGTQVSLTLHLADGRTVVVPMTVSPPTRLQ